MFRVNQADFHKPDNASIAGVVICLLLSLALTAGSLMLVIREYARFEERRLAGNSVLSPSELAALTSAISWQVLGLGVAVVVLTTSLIGTLWFWKRVLAGKQSLLRVKLLAHDILASTDQGVVTADPQGLVTSINSAALNLLSVAFECVGQPLDRISTPALPLAGLAQRVVAGNGSLKDLGFVTPLGKRIRADAYQLKDMDGDTLGCILHLRDVTERALIEERMQRMERFIGMSTLVAGLHHEIKNPLTGLSLHVQLIEERLQKIHSLEPVEEYLGIVKAEVQRLSGVLENFRNFANLQHLSIKPTQVSEILDSALRLVTPQARQQNIDVRLEQEFADQQVVPLDAPKFEQAVLNLLINGIEAMPHGGQLTLRTRMRGLNLEVEVADTGTGVADEVKPNLFKPYFSTKTHGTGMGLALTEKLVSQHGGNISFDTGDGGTTFRLTIPLCQDQELP